jgi:DNA uptake protein ComE-like DNA-binding protein
MLRNQLGNPRAEERIPSEQMISGGQRMPRPEKLWKELAFLALTALGAWLALLWLAGCSNHPQSDQQLKQQAAQTTQQVKAQAQQAAAEARVAAANAERKVNDVASGVKEGLNTSTPSGSPGINSVDVNSASEARLLTLPGISLTRARRIIKDRPYATPHDLVSKGAISQSEYDRISAQVVAGQ